MGWTSHERQIAWNGSRHCIWRREGRKTMWPGGKGLWKEVSVDGGVVKTGDLEALIWRRYWSRNLTTLKSGGKKQTQHQKKTEKNRKRILGHRIFMPGGLLQIIWFMFSVLQVKNGNSERVRDRLPVAQETLNPGCWFPEQAFPNRPSQPTERKSFQGGRWQWRRGNLRSRWRDQCRLLMTCKCLLCRVVWVGKIVKG